MGTWGPHSFDNDVAADWLGQPGSTDAASVEMALDALLDADDDAPFDADDASRAIAAAQIVADRADMGTLCSKAQMAVMAAAGANSELSSLWREAGVAPHAEWIAALQVLQAQLSGDRKSAAPASVTDVPQDRMLEAIETRLRGLEADILAMRSEMAAEFHAMRTFMQETRQ